MFIFVSFFIVFSFFSGMFLDLTLLTQLFITSESSFFLSLNIVSIEKIFEYLYCELKEFLVNFQIHNFYWSFRYCQLCNRT